MRFWVFLVAVLVSVFGSPPVGADLPELLNTGDQVSLGDRTFIVVADLGMGGMKTAYHLHDADSNCREACDVVVSIEHSMRSPSRFDAPPDLSERVGSRHVRRESALMTVETHSGPRQATVSEFAPNSIGRDSTFWAENPTALRLLAEQVYEGIRAFHQAGIVHLDIKPDNLLVGGRAGPVTRADLLSGRQYVWIADHDFAVEAGMTIDNGGVAGTLTYLSPESRTGHALHTERALWAASISLWRLYDRPSTFSLSPSFIRDAILRGEMPPDFLRHVRKKMSARANGLRMRGRASEADEVLYILTVIENGLQAQPGDRHMDLPLFAGEPATVRSRRLARIRRASVARARRWRCMNLQSAVLQLLN